MSLKVARQTLSGSFFLMKTWQGKQEHSRLAIWGRAGTLSRENGKGNSPPTKADWRMKTAVDVGTVGVGFVNAGRSW